MRRVLAVLLLGLVWAGSSQAQGLLVPADHGLQPLAMTGHRVQVAIEDQVAVTKVEQTFRNDTDRPLEATYIFPVPRGASVRKFSMWVDGKEVSGELVEADRARQIYTDIVRRTQDPGLLEYMDGRLLKLRVFPVPARGEQRLSLSYTAVAASEDGLVEYTYPLRAEKGTSASELAIDVTLTSQHPIQNIYSPSHSVSVTRAGDRRATVHCDHAAADRDFQLYYTSAAGDVGLTALLHRPDRTADGHFMLLISPRAELSKQQTLPRDMVFVLDTSGSMQGRRIAQAKAALKFCLSALAPQDRFALIHFATTVTKHTPGLVRAGKQQIQQARHWVDGLEAVGSTDINSALAAALEMRTAERGRTFTVVFFTDGQPTIGETNPERILENVAAKNTAETRIFTFGVGDDVNAVLLDRLADRTRSVSTYVREQEDIEAKVSGLYAKISHPVLTNLKLSVGPDVTLSEVYPPQLPDLFHGSQLVVLGRYHGHGHAKVTLSGRAGKETKEFVYEVAFPTRTKEEKGFVEDLWARRKVGYLLDQIRSHGDNKELVDEVVRLAKRYGIATPYTSYLVVPDGATPVASNGVVTNTSTIDQGQIDRAQYYRQHGYAIPSPASSLSATAARLPPGAPAPAPSRIQFAPVFVSPEMEWAVPSAATSCATGSSLPRGNYTPDLNVPITNSTFEEEHEVAVGHQPPALSQVQSGKLGVDLSEKLSQLRTQSQVSRSALRQANGRRCLEVRGVWIDDGFRAGMKMVTVKAQSAAYFRLLERQPGLREVFRLGNHLVWMTPSGTALVIDTTYGEEQLSDEEIDPLFVASK
jgi:Ca-activated chloride channel family protein